MTAALFQAVNRIPPAGLLSIGIGLFLVSFGAYHLYFELRASLTDERSPVTFSDESELLSAGRRAFAWVGGILTFLIGLGFLYMGGLDIYVCVFADSTTVRC